MKVFVSGGGKSGKSACAERIAAQLSKNAKPLYYAATMLPCDREDYERVARHRQSRDGLGFETVELGRDIAKLADICDMRGTFLLDSATALLANEMFAGKTFLSGASEKVADELIVILEAAANIVVVSDYIFSDSGFYDEYTEEYRKGLALVDRCCANVCDIVLEVCCGIPFAYKGGSLLDELLSVEDQI